MLGMQISWLVNSSTGPPLRAPSQEANQIFEKWKKEGFAKKQGRECQCNLLCLNIRHSKVPQKYLILFGKQMFWGILIFSYCMKFYRYVKMDSDIYRWWKIPNSGWERGILHSFHYALRYLHAPPVKKTWISPRRGSIDRKCGMFAGFMMRHDTFFVTRIELITILETYDIPMFIQICIKMSISGYTIIYEFVITF